MHYTRHLRIAQRNPLLVSTIGSSFCRPLRVALTGGVVSSGGVAAEVEESAEEGTQCRHATDNHTDTVLGVSPENDIGNAVEIILRVCQVHCVHKANASGKTGPVRILAMVCVERGCEGLQSSKTQNQGNRDFCVAVELYVPEERHWQKRAEPVSGYVDCCCCVIDICECLRSVASALLDRSVPCVRHRPAVEDNVQQGNEVHCCKYRRYCVYTVGELLSFQGDAHQHKRDAELDGNDGCTIEDLEKEEILLLSAAERYSTV
jgi:hypothetical protein